VEGGKGGEVIDVWKGNRCMEVCSVTFQDASSHDDAEKSCKSKARKEAIKQPSHVIINQAIKQRNHGALRL